MTCRRLADHAADKGIEMLVIYGGAEEERRRDRSVEYWQIKRSLLSFPLDEGLAYDPIFFKNHGRIGREIKEFAPNVIHITGINDLSIAGTYISWRQDIRLIASWHTNVHQFAARRIARRIGAMPGGNYIASAAEDQILRGLMLFHKIPKMTLAPNIELVDLLANKTGRDARLMERGVDTELFDPKRRTVNDNIFRIGFVGRLRAEKNVMALVDIENKLIEANVSNYRFLIVGEGNERHMLERKLKRAEFTGFLSGKQLAEAYANMDVFVFPSETDSFGNVAREANASGVPSIVTSKGGTQYVIEDGKTGFVASDIDDFAARTIELINDPAALETMRRNSREFAAGRTWEAVFDGVIDAYKAVIAMPETPPRKN